ncbi:hypothetical protein [Pseudomonas cremoricolorata]|uniref:hypothetical protein n=1 Tax=Pseudomonas cremoricolorata TaxID=157783 RepID=UPI0012B555FE|nr:hypothetical protein [Pseudomonas cremoricolorata]
MADGFEVVGDDFNIVVNATWVNYELWYKNSVTLDERNQAQFGAYAFNGSIFEVPQESGLAFISCSDPFVIMEGGWRNGKRLIGVSVEYHGQAVPIVTLYIFRKQAPVGSTSGVQLFDKQGILVFDGSSKFAKIATIVKPEEGVGKFALPSGRQYAVMLPQFAGSAVTHVREGYGSGLGGNRYTIIKQLYGHRFLCESDGVTLMSKYHRFAIAEFPSWTAPAGSSFSYSGGGFVVADVTGY